MGTQPVWGLESWGNQSGEVISSVLPYTIAGAAVFGDTRLPCKYRITASCAFAATMGPHTAWTKPFRAGGSSECGMELMELVRKWSSACMS